MAHYKEQHPAIADSPVRDGSAAAGRRRAGHMPEVPMGAFAGYAICYVRDPDSTPEKPKPDICLVCPGADLIVTTISGRRRPVSVTARRRDYFKSEMSEYDSQYVFVPLKHLQQLRNMEDRATAIQIKLKDYDDAAKFVKELAKAVPAPREWVQTWEDKQGPLLAAIGVERGILNVLLFMIIGVAGFGILAIFTMIVVEKTRDIGILKALGASNGGVMKIFLGYGLLLGVVGAGLGTALGVTITMYINEIEKLSGQ